MHVAGTETKKIGHHDSLGGRSAAPVNNTNSGQPFHYYHRELADLCRRRVSRTSETCRVGVLQFVHGEHAENLESQHLPIHCGSRLV